MASHKELRELMLICLHATAKQQQHHGNVVSKSMRSIAQIMMSRPVEVAVAPKTSPS